MATAELEREATDVVAFTIQPIDFATTKEEIEKVACSALLLRVADVNDKAGLDKCHQTRMQLRDMRVTIEKKRKDMKADALEYGRQVDSAAKELIAPIVAAETHLQEQENIVKREQDRLAREAEEKRQAMLRERLLLLQECGKSYAADDVAALSQEDFDSLLAAERADKKARDEEAAREQAERKRIAEEQRLEAERLAKEREELERQKQAEAERTVRMRARVTMLANLGYQHELSDNELSDIAPADWERMLGNARDQKAAIDKAAAEKQRVEEERLAEEKARLEKVRLEQEELQRNLDARLDALFQARMSQLREFAVPGTVGKPGVVVINRLSTENDFQEALAKAKEWKAEYDEKLRAEAAAEAKAKAEAAERERQRIEALRPDREKLMAVADAVRSITIPSVSEDAQGLADEFASLLRSTADKITSAVERMIPTQESAS